MTAPDRISLHAAVGDLSVLPVPDGVTVGSLGEDSVLLPERQWETLRAAARAVLDGQQIWWCEVAGDAWWDREFDLPGRCDLGFDRQSHAKCGHRILVEVPE